MKKTAKRNRVHHVVHRSLRPATFLTIIVSTMALLISVVFLLVIILTKPYQQNQDLRQQAAVPQDCISMVDLPRIECEALKTFYESTNGAGWTVNRGEIAWFSTPRACEWIGITCTGTSDTALRNVVGLNLTNRRLSGQLPAIWSSFSLLSQLDLSNNNLFGSLATTRVLDQTQIVSLSLTGNQFNGEIPDVFSSNHQLITLNLSFNDKLTGSLPVSLAKVATLRQLMVQSNGLTGSVPTAFQNLRLNVFLTRDTGLCLPTALTSWYAQIAQTDGLPSCSSTTPTVAPGSCNSICRDNSECPANLFCFFENTRTGRCRLPSNPSSLQCTASTAPTVTPSPTRAPTPTTASAPVVSCNQLCETNANCSNGLRCYDLGGEKRCRLATNPSSNACRGVDDQGLNFACNEYCSNSSECASNLTCWYNRCREPENVSSSSCTPPNTELRSLMLANCNESCSSNRDCVINMRCYSGSCRLATNPTSASCSTLVIQQPQPTTSVPKGGIITPSIESSPSPTSTQSATISATITTEPTTEPTLVPVPTAPPAGPSLIERFQSWWSNISLPGLSGGNLQETLQSKGLLIGLVAAGVMFLILGFVTGGKRKQSKSSQFSSPTPVTTQETQTTMIDRVKQKGIGLPK